MSYAIKVSNVEKIYKLYNSPKDRLKEALGISHKKLHKEFHALDNISFELKKGDTLGVIGKNGSGKSTLLKIIAGILPPSKGQVELNGKVSALIELGAGFSPEDTGLDNIYFYGMILGFSKEMMDKKIDEIISFADIGEFLYQPVKTYSSGMKARLAFSVAINTEPEILIVDEVLSVGDMFFKQKCINKLRVMLDDGLTLFFVSHSLGDIRSLCNKALFIDKGKQVAFGEVNNVCNLYQNQTSSQKDRSKREKLSESLMNQIDDSATLLLTNEVSPYFKDNKESFKHVSHRSGTHEFAYTSIEIYNTDNQPIDTIETFDTIIIRCSFVVHEDLPFGTALGLVCRDGKGNDIFVLNSDLDDSYLPELKKGFKGIWEIEIPNILLAPSEYSLSIGAKPNPSGDYYYDRIFNAKVFKVLKPKSASKTIYGKFYCMHKMQIKSGGSQ